MSAAAKFTLRFRNSRTHDLLGLVADQRGVSKNQLAEEMLERELHAAALLLARDLTGTLELLKKYNRAEHLEDAIEAFAQAEAAGPDPIQTRLVASAAPATTSASPTTSADVPTAWEDPPGRQPLISRNAAVVLQAIAARADMRIPPSVAMAQQWHRDLYAGVPRPYPYYAGEVRDSDPRFRDLIGYEVEVGGIRGVPSAEVPAELDSFQRSAVRFAERIDEAIPVGTSTISDTRLLHGVLTYCASLHGVWIRIQAFANGNGRTARLWANWAALRYGLPPFVTVKPRPRDPYGTAAQLSMTGDHSMMVGVMDQMLRDYLTALP